MPKILQNHKIRRILKIIGILLAIAVILYIIIQGRHYFNRRGVRQMQIFINSYGYFSPFAVIFLILLSTLLPPLPLPVPLIEIAAGFMFGFLPGFILVWISHILSSFTAFMITRFMSKNFFKGILYNRVFDYYRQYVKKRGAIAILIIRSTLANPFNIVSFLAGLTDMSMPRFLGATVAGSVPEAVLFTYIGSLLKYSRIRLWYVFIAVVLLSIFGPLSMYLIIRLVRKKKI